MTIKYFSFISALFCLSLLAYSISQASANSPFSSQKIIELVNRDRHTYNLPELKDNPALKLAAEIKLDDMAANNYFEHTSPQGVSPWYFINKAGYQYENAGENLALNFDNPEKLQSAWMNSTTHRLNITNPKFTDIGIAKKEVIYNGQRTNFIVEYFGAPIK